MNKSIKHRILCKSISAVVFVLHYIFEVDFEFGILNSPYSVGLDYSHAMMSVRNAHVMDTDAEYHSC